MFRKTLIIVVAILAVTGGTAAAAKLITGKDIKNGTITGKDVKNKSLGVKELSAKARTALTGAAGAPGAPGAPGAKGDKGDAGPQGERGPSNVFNAAVESEKVINSADDSREILGGQLAKGNYVVTGKFVVKNDGADFSKADCKLFTEPGGNGIQIPLDQVDMAISNVVPSNEQLIVLQGVVENDIAGLPYGLTCEPSGETYSLKFRDRSLIALQVATVETA